MGAAMNPVSIQRGTGPQAASQSIQQHIEVLRAHLATMRQMNASQALIEIVEEALRSAVENLQRTQAR
jgi:hypothetical protein